MVNNFKKFKAAKVFFLKYIFNNVCSILVYIKQQILVMPKGHKPYEATAVIANCFYCI